MFGVREPRHESAPQFRKGQRVRIREEIPMEDAKVLMIPDAYRGENSLTETYRVYFANDVQAWIGPRDMMFTEIMLFRPDIAQEPRYQAVWPIATRLLRLAKPNEN